MGDIIFDREINSKLLEECPNCKNINPGLHCSECGESKIILVEGKKPTNEENALGGFFNNILDKF